MQKTHSGRVAVVTGAGAGIGQVIAVRLAERGAQVLLVDLKDPVETKEKIGAAAVGLVADVSGDEGWQGIAAAAEEHFGRVDIVVNNAGIYPYSMIEDCDLSFWKRVFAVNLDSHFYSAKHFVPQMRKNGWGRFVNISSNSIGVAEAGLSAYNDVGPYGITVNAVLPSITNTPGMNAVPQELKERVAQLQAIHRIGEPDDIAGPVAFLTSDDARFVTGQAIVADGGLYKIS